MGRLLPIAAALAALVGCTDFSFPSSGLECSAQNDCPPGFLCDTVGGNVCLEDLATCGNAVVDSPEVCDDGNQVSGDGCRADCLNAEVCGDGELEPGEVCDDGNQVSGDGCRADCQKLEDCGDGELDEGEGCDDGDNDDTDACPSTCEPARCGDGFVHFGVEECDDGDEVSGDGCRADCLGTEVCGDGLLDVSEECDDGDNDDTDACPGSCKPARCGDGFVQFGVEVCDDGGEFSGDGCRGDCLGNEVCGDNLLDVFEGCDDGDSDDTDACPTNCEPARCGDGFVRFGVEQCDDANADETDACLSTCELASCGDGFVHAGVESCDDGNADETDTCLSTCELASCGDGFVHFGVEGCDDANADETDACLSTCEVASCGDGFVHFGVEACDDADADDTDACLSTCELASCGDGFVHFGVETCDDGDSVETDACLSTCEPASCGDGFLHLGTELCDDGNLTDGDECESDCRTLRVVQIAAGDSHSCALLDTGNVRCWGEGSYGQLGYGNTSDIGDDETPALAGNIDVGGTVVQIAAGRDHTCALLDIGQVRCGGRGSFGPLGYGNTNNIGDDETPASAGDINVAGTVVQIAAGSVHTCALLETGNVRCWGRGDNGRLGYGNTNTIGDDETPASTGGINVAGTVVQIAAGGSQTCALLDTGNVRCWGRGGSGQLGYGNTNDIGDDETPASAGDVDVGGTVVQISAGGAHTCALLDTGNVRCWGGGSVGLLGYGNTSDIGDDETPASAGDIDLGGTVVQIDADRSHTCALLDTGNVRCWGGGVSSKLGYGGTSDIGDDETPASAGDVDVGGTVVQVAAGGSHTCALLDTGNVRCWGGGDDFFGVTNFGQLGYGNTNTIGDDETPASAGDIEFGGTVVQTAAGQHHTCALLDAGNVRCWGLGGDGQLGYGNTIGIGDDETPASAGNIDVGGTVVQIVAGLEHTCALLDTGNARCWGRGTFGRLGYGDTNTIGDDETPASAGDIDAGGTVVQIAAGGLHTCALLDAGNVRCWGFGSFGQLGYGSTDAVFFPASAGDIDVGGTVVQIAVGIFHTCALLDTGNVRCWGNGGSGQLGHGNTNATADGSTADIGEQKMLLAQALLAEADAWLSSH